MTESNQAWAAKHQQVDVEQLLSLITGCEVENLGQGHHQLKVNVGDVTKASRALAVMAAHLGPKVVDGGANDNMIRPLGEVDDNGDLLLTYHLKERVNPALLEAKAGKIALSLAGNCEFHREGLRANAQKLGVDFDRWLDSLLRTRAV